jgi:hypothetical protein
LAIQNDFDHIKSEHDLGVVKHAEPDLGAPRDLAFLKSGDCFERTTEIFVGSRFYFDEDQRFMIAADNIDFAAGPVLEVAVENFVTALFQEFTGGVFAKAATDVFGVAR